MTLKFLCSGHCISQHKLVLRALKPILLVLLCSGFGESLSPEQNAWSDFKLHFISTDGRVIDNTNANISHSEGQGYGLLFAVYFNDPKAFSALWRWSQAYLQTRNDALFAWKYSPENGVIDKNNASDGDILIAWALLRAAKQWGNPYYLQEAQKVLVDIRDKLTCSWHGQRIILPAEQGFVSGSEKTTINLSYWVFPALLEFLEVDNHVVWQELIQSGLYFINIARYGQWQLPADWLELDDEVILSPDKPPVFGYEAIRIPLYLSWARLLAPGVAKRFNDFARASHKQVGYLSPVVNLIDNSLAEYPAPPGFVAIYRQLARVRVSLPNKWRDDSYYSRSLSLLAFIAQQ